MINSTTTRIACFGGIYNNYLALEAAIADARSRGVDDMFCLGDMGAFGPHPDRVFPLLHEHSVACIQGNYDDSIGNELDDCQCGYTDPRDNYFAQISYDYTLANTSAENRKFLQQLKPQLELDLAGKRVLLCHGSPRKVNEFLWESTTSSHFLDQLCQQGGFDAIACTHTGLKWERRLSDNRLFVNVGVLGRPENDGTHHVWYTLLSVVDGKVTAEFCPVDFDYGRLAREMRDEKLPAEFVKTVETGWWTTCLEVLPAKERRLGSF
jgi:predicted phosphodiesterase